jgi:cytochrome c peroxidase
MNFVNLSRSTKFGIDASVFLAALLTTFQVNADAFDAILKKAALENGFAPASATHVQTSPPLVPLGKIFFESKNLSLNSDVSCGDCHLDKFGSGDGIPLAIGIGGTNAGRDRALGNGAIIPRNTLALWGRGGKDFNVFFWDGRTDFSGKNKISPFGENFPSEDPLVTMIHLPAIEIREMLQEDKFISSQKKESVANAQNVFSSIIGRLNRNEAGAMAKLAGALRIEKSELSFVNIATAIAHFIRRKFQIESSPFHKYIFEEGKLSETERRGALLFYGKGKCGICHSGPYFSDFKFHSIAMPQLGFGKNGFGVDYGRYNATHNPKDLYRFRTPPLVNVAKTAPFGHSGSLATLDEAIIAHFDPLRFIEPNKMSSLDRHEIYKRMLAGAEGIVQIGYLDDQEVSDISEFLKSLSY